MGVCVWSPRLDHHGNSVRGIDFCRELVEHYNFHNYDSLVIGQSNKRDPRNIKEMSSHHVVVDLCWASASGNVRHLQNMVAQGISMNQADYDGRTPLHLAASENQLESLSYLLHHKVDINACDRWGNTPLDDALRAKNKNVIALLQSNGGVSRK